MSDTTNPSRRSILAGVPAAAIGIGATLPPALAAAGAGPDTELIELGRQLEAAWKASDELDECMRHDASDEAFPATEAGWNAVHEIVTKIETLQARTLAGLRVKARAAQWCHCGDEITPLTFAIDDHGTNDVRLAAGIVRDLLAI